MTFDEIMAPLGAENFPETIWGGSRCTCKGPPDKFHARHELGRPEPPARHDLGLVEHLADAGARQGVAAARRATPHGRRAGTAARCCGPIRSGSRSIWPGAPRWCSTTSTSSRPSCRLRAGVGGGAGRQGPGQPLPVVQAQAGIPGPLRLPRRVRHARHGREDLDGVQGPGRAPDQASGVRGLAAGAARAAQGRALARGSAAAGRPALPAARPVPLRARRRRPVRAHRLGRHLPDRHGRGHLWRSSA